MVMKLKVKELQTGWRKTTTWMPAAFPEISPQSRTEYIYIKKVLGLKP
jgi:hypothetical protein